MKKIIKYILKTIEDGIPLFVLILILQASAIAFNYVPNGLYFSVSLFLIGILKATCVALAFVFLSFRKRFLKLFYLIFNIILLEIYLFLKYKFRTGITTKILVLIFQTNPSEVTNFFSAFITIREYVFSFIILLAFILAYFFLEKVWRSKCSRLCFLSCNRKPYLMESLMFCAFFISVLSNLLGQTLYVKNSDFTKKLISSVCYTQSPFVEIYTSYQGIIELKSCLKYIKRDIDRIEIKNCDFRSPHIVLILGESDIKSHWSLYGYPHFTNPNLTRESENGNLFLFEDVITKHRYTSDCLLSIFPLSDLNYPTPESNGQLFAAILKKAGYNVSLVDNQCGRGSVDNVLADKFFFNPPEIESKCFDYRSNQTYTYDQQAIENWRDNVGMDFTTPSFTIFHLYGQHFDAVTRYPQNEGYEVFTADSVHREDKGLTAAMKKEIAEYDNATVYLDQTIKMIIDLYRDQDVIIVYSPDHGECLYDDDSLTYSRELGIEDSLGAVKALHEIPFFIWCSVKYIENHPDIVHDIKQATKNPFSNTDLSQLLLDISGIESDSSDRTYSPIGDKFIKRDRVLVNGTQIFEYDAHKSELDTIVLQSAYN